MVINAVNIAVSLIVLSLLGMSAIFGRHFKALCRLDREEVIKKINSDKISFRYICARTAGKIRCSFRKTAVPLFYSATEEVVYKLGLLSKNMEGRLLKINNRIRGKYRVLNKTVNGNGSKYWGDIIDFKNDLEKTEEVGLKD